MKIKQIPFTKVYRRLFAFELDNLRKLCNDLVDIDDSDRYALTMAKIDHVEGLQFEILAVGKEPREFKKGLDILESLGTLSYEFIEKMDAISIKEMKDEYIRKMNVLCYEEKATEGQLRLRSVKQFDCVRVIDSPDLFFGVFFNRGKGYQIPMIGIDYDNQCLIAEMLVPLPKSLLKTGIKPREPLRFRPLISFGHVNFIFEGTQLEGSKKGDTTTLGDVMDEIEQEITDKTKS